MPAIKSTRPVLLFLCLAIFASCSNGTVETEGEVVPIANTAIPIADYDAVCVYIKAHLPLDNSGFYRFGNVELRLRGSDEIRFGTQGHTTAVLRRGNGIVSLVKSRDGNLKTRNAAYAAFQELLAASKRQGT